MTHMWKAILYKEWIKTRWYLLISAVISCAFAGYAMLKLHRALAFTGAGHIWEVMVTRNAVFIDQMKYLPLIVGLLLAVVQFVPEMQRKCLKLTLRLPIPALVTLGTMLCFGLLALVAVFGINLMILYAGSVPILAVELVANIVGTAMPWYLSGVAAYLFGAWVILEPTWKFRIFGIFMSVLLLRIFFLAPVPCAFGGFFPVLVLVTLLSASLAWLSVVHFMAGKD